MTSEEFKLKRSQLREEYGQNDIALQKQYVEAINPYKQGDIIECLGTRILVENMKILFSQLQSFPSAIYYGKKLRKDNTPFKNGETGVIYMQNNPIKIEP